MVGDHHAHDIEPAARLGMRTVWLRDGRTIRDVLDLTVAA
jgi:FMN phosphatase YigB (HAD superfamily)